MSIPIPVWDRRQGPIGEAVAVLQQAALAREQTRLTLLGDLEINYQRLLVARQQIAAFEGGLIRQAESALQVAEAAFERRDLLPASSMPDSKNSQPSWNSSA